jgi:hypothetical protein
LFQSSTNTTCFDACQGHASMTEDGCDGLDERRRSAWTETGATKKDRGRKPLCSQSRARKKVRSNVLRRSARVLRLLRVILEHPRNLRAHYRTTGADLQLPGVSSQRWLSLGKFGRRLNQCGRECKRDGRHHCGSDAVPENHVLSLRRIHSEKGPKKYCTVQNDPDS